VPTAEVNNLRACVEALKSSVESLAGQRGDAANRAVTFRDLVSFGVISPAALQSSSGAGNAVGGIIGNYLPLTGGTLTGLLTLSGPPTAALHAATKAYVDGQAPLGGPYLPLTGGTLTGPVTLTNATQATINFNNTTPAITAGGLWRWTVGTGGNMNLQSNTAAAGDWSTTNNTMYMTPAGVLTVLGNLGLGTVPAYQLHLKGSGVSEVRIESANFSKISFNATTSAADQGRWQFYAGANSFYFQTLNDAENAANNWMTVSRLGNGASVVSFPSGVVSINNNLYFANVTSGNGPRMYANITDIIWELGSGNGSWYWWNNSNNPAMTLTGSGNLVVSGWFSTGLNTAAYPSGTGAFAVSWNHTQGAGETDFWNTYQSAGGFNSFHFWQMTGASTAIDIMQVGPSGLQLSGILVTTGAQSGWNMNDRLAGQTPSGWVIYPSGGKLIIYNNFNSDAYYFYYSAFVPAHDNANWCGQAGTAWYACQSYAYNTSSDMRHKTDIEDLPGCLDFVRRLAPKRFKFNNAPPEDRQRSHWGFIAQEVGAAFRETDFGGHRADPAGESISYNELTAVLWKVCQELLARVEQLEAA
jgi:hypothetical protein